MKEADFRLTLLALFAVLCLLAAPFCGPTLISPCDALDPASPENLIFWRLRLPRSLAAFLAGAGLSVCGLAFQALFLNPLATPYTLGVSSGAALGAAAYSRLGAQGAFIAPAGVMTSALAGSVLSMLLVFGLSRAAGRFSVARLLLAGVIVNFFFSSLVMFIQYLSDAHDAVQIMRWLMGGVAGADAAEVAILALAAFAALAYFSRLAPELDLLTAGEEIAASRGVETGSLKFRVFAAASLLTGAIVSATGPIGFVGMMMPELCRMMLGHDHARLAPAAFLLGGAFLALCDLLARSLLAPAELPLGILTAMTGAPFFLWMLFRGDKTTFLQ